MKLVPEYGYWKDFQNMVGYCFTNEMAKNNIFMMRKI